MFFPFYLGGFKNTFNFIVPISETTIKKTGNNLKSLR